MKTKIFGKVIVAIANGCSILSLIAFPDMPLWLRILIAIFATLCVICLVWQAVNTNKRNEITCKSDEEIKSVMRKLISQQGKVCIMRRALSWIDEDTFATILKKKDSITIYAEIENEKTSLLRKNGISVKLYGKYGFTPKTRFSIIRYGRANPQISIADAQSNIRKGKTLHRIYQTSEGNQDDSYIVSLANDMINMMEKVCD